MSFARQDFQILFPIAGVYEPVVVVNAPAVGFAMFERLRLPNALHKAVSLLIVYKQIDPFKGLFIPGLPFDILLKGIGREYRIIHSP
jgi:hypothetical protein